jgi:hypothetical protein
MTIEREVRIIYEKDDRPAAPLSPGEGLIHRTCPACPVRLRLFAAAFASSALKERDWKRLAVNTQLKIFLSEFINEASLLIKDRDACLNQFCADSYSIVFLNLRRATRTRLILLSLRQHKSQAAAKQSCQKISLE